MSYWETPTWGTPAGLDRPASGSPQAPLSSDWWGASQAQQWAVDPSHSTGINAQDIFDPYSNQASIFFNPPPNTPPSAGAALGGNSVLPGADAIPTDGADFSSLYDSALSPLAGIGDTDDFAASPYWPDVYSTPAAGWDDLLGHDTDQDTGIDFAIYQGASAVPRRSRATAAAATASDDDSDTDSDSDSEAAPGLVDDAQEPDQGVGGLPTVVGTQPGMRRATRLASARTAPASTPVAATPSPEELPGQQQSEDRPAKRLNTKFKLNIAAHRQRQAAASQAAPTPERPAPQPTRQPAAAAVPQEVLAAFQLPPAQPAGRKKRKSCGQDAGASQAALAPRKAVTQVERKAATQASARGSNSKWRAPLNEKPGPKPNKPKMSFEHLYLYAASRLSDRGIKKLAKYYDTRTDCLQARRVSFLRYNVLPYLPEWELGTGLVFQVGNAKSRKPTLNLDAKRVKAEGLLTWQAFHAKYIPAAPLKRGPNSRTRLKADESKLVKRD